jgi:hypothetical protein
VGSVSETGAGGRGGEEGEESRPYEMLMDTFSLHEFMIRKGSVIDTTPEFESYRRTYQPLWAVIQPLIQQLEVLCKQVGGLAVGGGWHVCCAGTQLL